MKTSSPLFISLVVISFFLFKSEIRAQSSFATALQEIKTSLALAITSNNASLYIQGLVNLANSTELSFDTAGDEARFTILKNIITSAGTPPLILDLTLRPFTAIIPQTSTVAINVGIGEQILVTPTGTELQFRTLTAGNNIVLTQNANDINIAAVGTLGDITTGFSLIQPTVWITPNHVQANIGLTLLTKGTGPLTASIPDNTIVGGNVRGANAVDWQMIRASASQAATGDFSVICGGASNTAAGVEGFVGAGSNNSASGIQSFVGSGLLNTASNTGSFIGAGSSNASSGSKSFVGAGTTNAASGDFSVVCGGANNVASVAEACVGAGSNNSASGIQSFVGSGSLNTASNMGSFIGAGTLNTASGLRVFIGAGDTNSASGDEGFIGAGNNNIVNVAAINGMLGGGSGNQVLGQNAALAGGTSNTITGSLSFIGGGTSNMVSGQGSGICAGGANTASGQLAFIGAGSGNVASGSDSVISGGINNTASGTAATGVGGQSNTASGSHATVCGGSTNVAAGDFSFAAGSNAQANNLGSFVLTDNTGATLASSANNQMTMRFAGGTNVWSNAGATLGVGLAANATAWGVISDKNLKENFEEIDKLEILEKLAAVPVTKWNYKGQDASVKHIGPMAQDFWPAFNLGSDSLKIETLDFDGVALASIQGLYKVCQELRERVELLEKQCAQ